MSNIVRREFIMLLGSAATWPLAAYAQKNNQVRRVGVIMGFAENDEVWRAYLANFRQGLQELGWIDGRNIRFDYRFTGDSEELMRSMAEEVVALHVPEIVPNVAFLHVVQAAAPSLGVSVIAAAVRNAADIERVLSAFGQEGGGLIVTPSALTATRRNLIIALAARLILR